MSLSDLLSEAWEDYITGGDRCICDPDTAMQQHMLFGGRRCTLYENAFKGTPGYTYGVDPGQVLSFPHSDSL